MTTPAVKLGDKEREVLALIARGHYTCASLATATGRASEGCAQTAASLVRKGLAVRERPGGIVHFRLTNAGRRWLPRRAARRP